MLSGTKKVGSSEFTFHVSVRQINEEKNKSRYEHFGVDVTVIAPTFTFQTLCLNSVWLTIERLNIWTSGPLRGWSFLKDGLFVYIHHCLKSQPRGCVHVLPWKGILGPAERTCMSLGICHRRAPAKHWICSRARRQPSTDEVHEGCCERKKHHYRKEYRTSKHACFLSRRVQHGAAFFFSWALFSGCVALIYLGTNSRLVLFWFL